MLRLERKYLVPNYLMDDLRKRILPFVRPDINAKSNGSSYPQYVVRSIYYDSPNLDCYIEKKEGVQFRRKFRIRGYGYHDDNNNQVVFEIKRKIENRIKKHRAFVNLDNVVDILETGNVEKYVLQDRRKYEVSLDDARRFFYHVKKYNYVPTVLVVYEREAYHGKFDTGVRITLDKNIRSLSYPEITGLYNESDLAPLFKSHFKLEIKYFTHIMPLWAKSLVQEFRLRHEALSKYVIGYDACRKRGQRAKLT